MDIENKFKDLDVAEGIKEMADTPSTLPMPGNSTAVLNSKILASTIAELIGQKKFAGMYEVGVTMTAGQHINTISYSYDYIMQHVGNTVNNVAPTFYRGFRADLKVTVEVTSMFQQQGAIIVNNIIMPSVMYNALIRNITTLPNLCKFPRSFITFGHSGTYTYTLPWQSNMEFWPFKQHTKERIRSTMPQNEDKDVNNGYMDNGRIVFRVFNPLRVVENVTNVVPVRFWVQLDNLRFYAYQPNENL